jgi:mRNA interferase HigB
MEVFGKGILSDFKAKHGNARDHADAWLQEAEEAVWDTPHAVKAKYPKASIVGDNQVVFNIVGNRYRFLVKMYYQQNKIIIKWAGTHAAYDRLEIGN